MSIFLSIHDNQHDDEKFPVLSAHLLKWNWLSAVKTSRFNDDYLWQKKVCFPVPTTKKPRTQLDSIVELFIYMMVKNTDFLSCPTMLQHQLEVVAVKIQNVSYAITMHLGKIISKEGEDEDAHRTRVLTDHKTR